MKWKSYIDRSGNSITRSIQPNEVSVSMKLNFDAQPADDAQIQIIPLIDVIFCILTFFILAALQLTRQQGINLDLPKASTAQVQMREMLVVTIDSAGQTYIDKQLVDRLQLYQAIKEYHTQKPEGLLVLNAAQTAFYNDVVQVLDILRSVGGDRVALATAPQTNPSPTTSPLPGTNPLAPGVTSPDLIPSPSGLSNPGGLPGSTFPGSTIAPTLSPGLGPSPFPGSTLPNQTTPNQQTSPSSAFPSPVGPGTPP
jgi:biopolymer transport protein ExbD